MSVAAPRSSAFLLRNISASALPLFVNTPMPWDCAEILARLQLLLKILKKVQKGTYSSPTRIFVSCENIFTLTRSNMLFLSVRCRNIHSKPNRSTFPPTIFFACSAIPPVISRITAYPTASAWVSSYSQKFWQPAQGEFMSATTISPVKEFMSSSVTSPIKNFMKYHYRHFNAAVVIDASEGYNALLAKGGKMFVTLAGAMSTAELGLSLAEMIRQDKVHGICCTGANLEEDLYNLVAHDHYERVPHYRQLTPKEETALLNRHLNRVTDTCIPEEEAMRRIERVVMEEWYAADRAGQRFLPHQFLYKILRDGKLKQFYQIDPKDSWMMAAAEKDLPVFVPGWEDSTLGNMFDAQVIGGKVKNVTVMRSGVEYMMELAKWYTELTAKTPLGFFQIGGGIAGDFPICVVPMLHQDLKREHVPLWAYFCQISDSTTSYGSYSGAVPNEKITWGKLGEKTPKYIIESDASIVAPLVFAYVLGW